MTWAVREARPGDINRIANRMRAIDRLEVGALGKSPKEALRQSLGGSTLAFTGLKNGTPECMGGVVPLSLLDGEGAIWLLGTDALTTGGRHFLTTIPQLLGMIQKDYPKLSNMIAAENCKSIRWLRKLGFDISEELCDIGGVAFRHFSRGE